jgi:hypothetical protein
MNYYFWFLKKIIKFEWIGKKTKIYKKMLFDFFNVFEICGDLLKPILWFFEKHSYEH